MLLMTGYLGRQIQPPNNNLPRTTFFFFFAHFFFLTPLQFAFLLISFEISGESHWSSVKLAAETIGFQHRQSKCEMAQHVHNRMAPLSAVETVLGGQPGLISAPVHW